MALNTIELIWHPSAQRIYDLFSFSRSSLTRGSSSSTHWTLGLPLPVLCVCLSGAARRAGWLAVVGQSSEIPTTTTAAASTSASAKRERERKEKRSIVLVSKVTFAGAQKSK